MSNKSKTVSVEFFDTLAEQVYNTLAAALDKINAPQEIKDLAKSQHDISTVIFLADSMPEGDEYPTNTMAQAVNNISKAGGVFYAESGSTTPRKGTLLGK